MHVQEDGFIWRVQPRHRISPPHRPLHQNKAELHLRDTPHPAIQGDDAGQQSR